jgi:lipid-binding SYLF domain-containing protein
VAGAGDAPGAVRIAESIRVLADLVDIPEEGLPSKLLDKCYGLAVIPGVVKAAYGFGGQYGRGLIVVKNEQGEWSNPVFISLIGGSIGWQIGVQKSDVILVFKTRRGIDNVVKGDLTLGADIGVAAGPVGRSAEASTDLELKAEIYSYSKSRGLFAGISIKGATLQADEDANQAFYGRDLEPGDIFIDRDISGTPGVEDLKKALDRYTAKRF